MGIFNSPVEQALPGYARDEVIEVLESIEKRVLWLSTLAVHHANHIRPKPDGSKVGGHQASSASLVSIMTALYFSWLRAGDRVSVKPHASPVLHAIHALLGNLPVERLQELRSYQGLQAYPSRTKDPDPIDFSTGSVGLGAVAPNFAALSQAYVRHHFGNRAPGRFVALVGDGELNEGSVWEALTEEMMVSLSNVLWIVDLNHQSLDRITPEGQAHKYMAMFRTLGWHVMELKYGRRLETAFQKPGGEVLRRKLESMARGEYLSLLQLDGGAIRQTLVDPSPDADGQLHQVLTCYSDAELKTLLWDAGGHDLSKVLDALTEAEQWMADQPVVIFAHTLKGRGLAFAGDPLNHSALLTNEQIEALRCSLDIAPETTFQSFSPQSAEGHYIACYKRHRLLEVSQVARPLPALEIPETLGMRYSTQISTQQALGQILLALSRLSGLADRLVTVSPDVALTTNLGGWLDKVGIYGSEPRPDHFDLHGIRHPVRWRQTPEGRHMELGISESNFFLLLGALGLSHESNGEVLFPVGVIYDVFIPRGLDALTYAVYSGAKFILVGTPSGITLSPEGGSHQSLLTPSIGLEMPDMVAYEPAFAHEVEWILLAGLQNLLDREHGQTVYLRLSTRVIDQGLLPAAWLAEPAAEAQHRQAVLRGGYRLVDYRSRQGYDVEENVLNLFVAGVMVVEAVEASRSLADEGIYANVIVVTSPDLIYRDYIAKNSGHVEQPDQQPLCYLHQLVPLSERRAPVITVIDGHSHTLSFIGGALGAHMVSLGVNEFGQSGTHRDLYDRYGIGVTAIKQAAWRAITMV